MSALLWKGSAEGYPSPGPRASRTEGSEGDEGEKVVPLELVAPVQEPQLDEACDAGLAEVRDVSDQRAEVLDVHPHLLRRLAAGVLFFPFPLDLDPPEPARLAAGFGTTWTPLTVPAGSVLPSPLPACRATVRGPDGTVRSAGFAPPARSARVRSGGCLGSRTFKV